MGGVGCFTHMHGCFIICVSRLSFCFTGTATQTNTLCQTSVRTVPFSCCDSSFDRHTNCWIKFTDDPTHPSRCYRVHVSFFKTTFHVLCIIFSKFLHFCLDVFFYGQVPIAPLAPTTMQATTLQAGETTANWPVHNAMQHLTFLHFLPLSFTVSSTVSATVFATVHCPLSSIVLHCPP